MPGPSESNLVWRSHPWTFRLLVVSVVLAIIGTVVGLASGNHYWAVLTAIGAIGLFVHLVALACYQLADRR
jgi:hypothetical protein